MPTCVQASIISGIRGTIEWDSQILFKRLISVSKRITMLKRQIEAFRREITRMGAGEIARRYFVMNAFDGALTILGIVVGFAISGEGSSRHVVSAGAGAGLAMGISGGVGAYMAEIAERRQQLRELEKHMHHSLKGSRMDRAIRLTAFWVALVDGISPAIAAAIPIAPFLLVGATITFHVAVIASIILNLVVLFILGAFLGRVSRGSMWLHGVLMMGAGGITVLILLFASSLP